MTPPSGFTQEIRRCPIRSAAPPSAPGGTLNKLKAERVELLLKSVPAWSLSADGTALERRMKAQSWSQTLTLVRRAARLAHEERHLVELTLKPGEATVRLTTPEAGGLTLADFALAGVIGAR